MNQPIKPHVLVVGDDEDIRDILTDALEEDGYQATTVANEKAMWEAMNQQEFDLLLMDLRLNKENGLQLARKVRAASTVPIMMLTGKGDETDRIIGLELEADGYLVKPLDIRELLAWVRVLIRRNTELSKISNRIIDQPHDQLHFGDWILDLTSRTLNKASGKSVDLTFAEFNLLSTLVNAPDCVLFREKLIEKTCGIESEVFDRTIDVLILRLRRKIEANPKQPRYILTERGIGYAFVGPVRAG